MVDYIEVKLECAQYTCEELFLSHTQETGPSNRYALYLRGLRGTSSLDSFRPNHEDLLVEMRR